MPLYEYQCTDCGARDHRIAGIDDHVALCIECGGLMVRLDEDVFKNLKPDEEKEYANLRAALEIQKQVSELRQANADADLSPEDAEGFLSGAKNSFGKPPWTLIDYPSGKEIKP